MRYAYEVSGSAADGQTWFVGGEVEAQGGFHGAPALAIRDAFDALTHGEAIYGRPGVGCKGPYKINRLLIEEKERR